jgi:hypothetical protein
MGRGGKGRSAHGIGRITASPTEVPGLPSGELAVGAPADVCVFDAEATWQLTPETLTSGGKNSPWMGSSGLLLRAMFSLASHQGAIAFEGFDEKRLFFRAQVFHQRRKRRAVAFRRCRHW